MYLNPRGGGVKLKQDRQIDLKKLQKTDPLRRSAEKQSEAPEYSPMNPPDAYSPPAVEEVPYGEMPKFLQKMMDDHKAFQTALESFEEALGEERQQRLF